jgi:ABC-type multidrug transport system fused ATPase/permease subunit
LYQAVSLLEKEGAIRLDVLPIIMSLCAFKTLEVIVNGQLYFTGRRFSNRSRIILIDELYRKSLNRVQSSNADDDENASLGKIVTLMSVDAEQIRNFLSYFQDCFISLPISLIISLTSLYFVLGWSSLGGIGIMLIISPLSGLIGSSVVKYEQALLEKTDSRVAIMNEVLQGIRIIKYFGWENHFSDKIKASRDEELRARVRVWVANIGFYIIGGGSSILIILFTFMCYTILEGKVLNASTAFTTIGLMEIVGNLMVSFPYQIMDVLKSRVSLKRIEEFLAEQDVEKYKNDSSVNEDSKLRRVVAIKNAELVYHGEAEGRFTLRDISVDFPIGKLTLIAGSTGAGKSSLLTALLGEMKLVRGSVFFPTGKNRIVNPNTGLSETVAYAAQTPWLLNATIRDNILFGEEYDEKRYNAVIKGCALAKDLENLEGGDLTEIGEKGINVSGGQKQRISLARVCYSRAAYVLLDDPLSAVDAPTARFLLHKCIVGLLKGRTIILVSHATAIVLPFAEHILVMKKGEIVLQGSPEQVTQNANDDTVKNILLTKDVFDDEKEGYSENDGHVVAAVDGSGTQLISDEEKATGSVKFSVYKGYFFAAGGAFFLAAFFLSHFVDSFLRVFKDWWVKVWTDHNHDIGTTSVQISISFSTRLLTERFSWLFYSNYFDRLASSNVGQLNDSSSNDTTFYVVGYAIIGLVTIVWSIMRQGIFLCGSYSASKKLHERLVTSVLFSPLRFFEVTPIGRILNRFSKDIGGIDDNVIFSIIYFLYQLFSGLSIISLIGTVAPLFLLIVPFIAFAYIAVSQIYLISSRELKRIESNERSPIYAQFSETLAGVVTLRAFGVQERFLRLNESKLDANQRPFHFVWIANRWLCIRTELMAVSIVFGAGLAVIFTDMSPGLSAMVLQYSFEFVWVLVWSARMHAEMEMNMNSVERVIQYSELPQEPPSIIENNRPFAGWPLDGAIDVKDLSIRYAPDLPDVLKKVSFKVSPHEKIAIVGRTGNKCLI